MSRLTIFTICCFLLLGAAVASPAEAGKGDCSPRVGVGYDPNCDWYNNPRPSKLAIPDEVCVYFIQTPGDNAVMELTLGDGTKRRYSPTRWMNAERSKGRFCIGRHWLRGKTTWINICDAIGSADYFGADIEALAAKPIYSEELTACLFGSDACKAMGFKSWR